MEHQNWERQAIEKLAFSAVQEQRRARHWSIFFKTLGFVYLFALLFIGLDWIGPSKNLGSHTALIDIQGEIGAEGQVTADNTIASLQSAFEDTHTKAIILRINSPGGSPVQAGIINDEIKRQRKLHPSVPVYAVVEDICASGGYYIAAAADKIYVDKASIVGSIGVIMDGFGFTGAMQKLGVERRVMTAGENKALLDPYSPVNPAQKAFAQSLLNEVHQQFIQVVREGRGKRLHETPDMFSGLFWTGAKSIELGLADGLGTSESVARDVVKEENIVDFTTHEGFADRFAKRFGASMANTLSGASVKLH
jgi:protease-4